MLARTNTRRWSPRAPLLASALLAGLLLVAPRPGQAANTEPDFIGGLTLGSVGAAASLVSGVGSFAHIALREHAGVWGWLSLFSGLSTTIGGIVLASAERDARAGGSAFIALGVMSAVTGLVGLTLERPEPRARALRVAPLLLESPGGRQVAALGVQGVF